MKNKNASGKNQSPEKSPYILLKEKLAELRKNAGLLAAKKDEVHDAALDASRKAIAAGEVRDEASRFLSGLRGKPDNHSQQIQLDRWESAAVEAETAAKEANDKVNRLNDEISDLKRGPAGMMFDFQAEDILAYQEEKAKAEGAVASLEESIRQQEAVIETAMASVPVAPDFARQREDLLAEVAIGGATEADLQELDREAAGATDAVNKAKADAQEIIAPARQTISGLRRKLATAQDELSTIKAIGPDVMNQYFRSEAERLGSEYVALALQLIDRYEKLLAYDKMLGHPSQLRTIRCGDIMLPTFRLKACDGLQHHRDIFEFRAAKLAVSSERQQEVHGAELTRMKGLGIEV
jgi:hypothetical protein